MSSDPFLRALNLEEDEEERDELSPLKKRHDELSKQILEQQTRGDLPVTIPGVGGTPLVIPSEVTGAFKTVADLLTRSNFAIAGTVDAAIKGDDTPLELVAARELFSGVAGFKGKKRTFVDILEDTLPDAPIFPIATPMGVLSVPRGLAAFAGGLALDIGTDPITFATFGASNAVKIPVLAGNRIIGGIRLSKRGQRVFNEVAKAQRPEALRYAEFLGKTAPDGRYAKFSNMKETLSKANNVELFADEIARDAAASKVNQMIAEGATELADAGGIKFFGRTVVPTAPVTGKIKEFFLKRKPIQDLLDDKTSFPNWLDRTFNETDKFGRSVPGYVSMKTMIRDMEHKGQVELGRTVDVLMGRRRPDGTKVPRSNWLANQRAANGEPLNTYITRHIDDPEKFPIDAIPVEWRPQVTKIRQLMGQWFEEEARRGLIDPNTFRENYVFHLYDNTSQQMEQLDTAYKGFSGNPSGFGLRAGGPWKEERVFNTYDDALGFVDRLKSQGHLRPDFELKPVYNIEEILNRRGAGHIKSVAVDEFTNRVKMRLSRSDGELKEEVFDRLLPRVSDELFPAKAPNIASDEVIKVSRLLQKSWARRSQEGVKKELNSFVAVEKEITTELPDHLKSFEAFKQNVTSTRRVTGVFPERQPLQKRFAFPKDVKEVGTSIGGRIRKPSELTDEFLKREFDKARRIALKPQKVRRQVPKFGPEEKAAFVIARSRTFNSLEDMATFFDDFADEIAEVDPQAIRKVREAMGDERRNVAKAWGMFGEPLKQIDIAGSRFQGWWLPKQVADDLARFEDQVLGKDLRLGLNKLDTMMDVFKFSVTALWPAFHFRNAYSNVAQNFVSIGMSALNPNRYVRALAVMHGADGTLSTPLRRLTFEEVRQLSKEGGILKNFAQLSEFRGKASFLSRTPFKQIGAAGAEIENTSRMMLFMKHLEDGTTPQQAEALAKKFLFDYEALSKFERNVLSRMIPFYIWNKKNLALTSQQLARRPGRYATMVKLARPGDRGPEQEALPDYLRGDMKVRISREGGTTFVTGIDLPLNSALDLIYTGDVVETMRRNVGMLGPALKIMIEVPTKTDLFTGRSLEERQYLRGFGKMVDSFPAPIKDYLEFKKGKNKKGEDIYTINGLKAYILFRSYAFSRFYSTFDRIMSEDQTFMGAMLDVVTGLRSKEVEFSEQDERIIKNQIRRYEQHLHRTGELIKKPIFFKPRTAEEEEEAPELPRKQSDPFLEALGIEEE